MKYRLKSTPQKLKRYQLATFYQLSYNTHTNTLLYYTD